MCWTYENELLLPSRCVYLLEHWGALCFVVLHLLLWVCDFLQSSNEQLAQTSAGLWLRSAWDKTSDEVLRVSDDRRHASVEVQDVISTRWHHPGFLLVFKPRYVSETGSRLCVSCCVRACVQPRDDLGLDVLEDSLWRYQRSPEWNFPWLVPMNMTKCYVCVAALKYLKDQSINLERCIWTLYEKPFFFFYIKNNGVRWMCSEWHKNDMINKWL